MTREADDSHVRRIESIRRVEKCFLPRLRGSVREEVANSDGGERTHESVRFELDAPDRRADKNSLFGDRKSQRM